MTTPLAHEPRPGDGLVPYMTGLVDRLYRRLPEVYRTMDARDSTWAFKRYLGAVLHQAGLIDDRIDAIAGDNPIGPAAPEPVGLPADELETWRAARRDRLSALGDPAQADAAWLPWLAQLVGARLDPAATLAEQRDTITFATSGYRAGTRQAIADAARSALTGSRYAQVVPHVKPDSTLGLIAATPWDITIVTRGSETPDPNAVLGAVLRKGVKPAGAVLWTRTSEASWDAIEAQYPGWSPGWDEATWTQIEEAGLTYANVPDNLVVNPSFETNTTGWSPVNSAAIDRVPTGVDGAWTGRTTSANAGVASGMVSTAAIASINDERTYRFGVSLRPHVALSGAALSVQWLTAASAIISTTTIPITAPTVGGWNRVTTDHLAPTNADKAKITISVGTLPVGEYCDVDAVLFRLV